MGRKRVTKKAASRKLVAIIALRFNRLSTARGRWVRLRLYVFLLMISLMISAAMTSCAAQAEAVPCARDAGCLSYSVRADIPILDPHRADAPEAGMIFRQIYDTLVYRGADRHDFIPGLATDWDVSADGLAYTFRLRRDVRFHSGDAFDAEAVAKTIDRIFDPNLPGSRARTLLGPLSQYEVLDEYGIRLYLFAPYEAFLDAWAQPYLGIANPRAVGQYNHLRYQFHQDGTGPFRLTDYLPGERVRLERNHDYNVLPAIYQRARDGEFERVEFSFALDSGLDTLALLAEQFDVIDDIAPIDAQTLSGNSRVRILPNAIPGQAMQFLFNTNRAHLNDQAVRRALLLATNRIAISNLVYMSFSAPAWAPLSASTGYANTSFVNQFAYDQAEAQRLLAAAGYRDLDQDGILERQGASLSLRVLAPPWERLPEVAEFLRREWRAIGVVLEIEPVPGRARLEALAMTGEYDLIPILNYGIDPNLLSHVFLDSAVYRAAHAPDPRLTDLLLAARQERDSALRRTLYYEAQAVLMNDTLVLPIRENVRLTVARADVQGMRFDAYGFYPLLYNARRAIE